MHPTLQDALRHRTVLLETGTTAFRWIDGHGDGCPGIEVEQLGEHILLSTRSPYSKEQFDLLSRSLPGSIYHRVLDSHIKESPQHYRGSPIDGPFIVTENRASFELSFHSGYSQGIFLDQRDNRRQIREHLQPGQTLLNTFSYTGAFSVFGALAGAVTTTIDLSQPYLDWSKRNFLLNQLDPAEHHFCRGDTFHWLNRFSKQGRQFDTIVLDPPTFSRDAKGKVFRVEKDYGRLIEMAEQCLKPDGTILACTNFRQMSPSSFMKQIRSALMKPAKLKSLPMPLDFTDAPYLKSVWINV